MNQNKRHFSTSRGLVEALPLKPVVSFGATKLGSAVVRRGSFGSGLLDLLVKCESKSGLVRLDKTVFLDNP